MDIFEKYNDQLAEPETKRADTLKIESAGDQEDNPDNIVIFERLTSNCTSRNTHGKKGKFIARSSMSLKGKYSFRSTLLDIPDDPLGHEEEKIIKTKDEEFDIEKAAKEQEEQEEYVSPLELILKDRNTIPIKPYLKLISRICFPGMLYFFTLLLMNSINLIVINQKSEYDKYIGDTEEEIAKYKHLGKLAAIFAGVIGKVDLLMNCTIEYVIEGLAGGIETLCSNALASGKLKLMGYYYQRARIVTLTYVIVLLIVHFFSSKYSLKALIGGEQEDRDYLYEHYAKKYIIPVYFYCFFDALSACNCKLLNTMGKTHINFFVLLTACCLHPLWNLLYHNVFHLGIMSASLSLACSKFILFLLSTIYLWFKHPYPEASFWINKKCFEWKGIKSYLAYSIGAALLYCAEALGSDLQSFIPINMGTFDVPKGEETITIDYYSVYVKVLNVNLLLYCGAAGFMVAIVVIIGGIIIKGSVKQIKLAIVYVMLFAICFQIIYLGIYTIFRYKIFYLYGTPDDLYNQKELLLYSDYLEFFDLCQLCLVSVFKGLSKQYLASIFMFIHYYILVLGSTYLLGLKLGWKLKGFYLGFSTSDLIMSITYTSILLCLDLKKAQDVTLNRIKEDMSRNTRNTQMDQEELAEMKTEKNEPVQMENKEFKEEAGQNVELLN